jgi:hypothetical protein
MQELYNVAVLTVPCSRVSCPYALCCRVLARSVSHISACTDVVMDAYAVQIRSNRFTALVEAMVVDQRHLQIRGE